MLSPSVGVPPIIVRRAAVARRRHRINQDVFVAPPTKKFAQPAVFKTDFKDIHALGASFRCAR